jgi:hypothetical protein
MKDKNWYRYIDCVAFDQYLSSKNKYIDNLKSLAAKYLTTDTRNPNHRSKRGILNLIGEISKIVLGILTQSDARSYNIHISELDKEQKEFLHLAKEQMTIIKTTNTSVNSTIERLNQNEKASDNELIICLIILSRIRESANLLNEQHRLIQRGIDESRVSFETLIEAAKLITSEKIKNLIAMQRQITAKWSGLPKLSFSRTIQYNYS